MTGHRRLGRHDYLKPNNLQLTTKYTITSGKSVQYKLIKGMIDKIRTISDQFFFEPLFRYLSIISYHAYCI